MKHITTFIFILLTTYSFAQNNFPRVEKIVVEDKLLHGQIDKYPITIYLKFKQYSNYHAGVYSVDGWYYYDKVKKKIPLAGLFDNSELFLYQFNDSVKSNELFHFLEMRSNHWEDMEYYKNLKGYKEKFTITEEENSWTNDTKQLDLSIEQNDVKILVVREYLLLDSTTTFDLNNFGSWTWNFELAANRGNKYVLKYEHGSRLYVMGMCGAGLEKGYMTVEFDKENKLLNYEEFVFESCNGSISEEEQESSENGVIFYHCHDYSKDESYDLKVDLNEMKIERKEKN